MKKFNHIEKQPGYSWSRVRSKKELLEFINRKLLSLENISLD